MSVSLQSNIVDFDGFHFYHLLIFKVAMLLLLQQFYDELN